MALGYGSNYDGSSIPLPYAVVPIPHPPPQLIHGSTQQTRLQQIAAADKFKAAPADKIIRQAAVRNSSSPLAATRVPTTDLRKRNRRSDQWI